MSLDTRDVALASVFASLYALINLIQMFSPFGNPSIYGPIQLRFSDFLIALAALLGMPVVLGVTFGCTVVNVFGSIGPLDIVFGSLANFLAATFVMRLRKRRLSACVAGAMTIGAIVGGGYLWMYYPWQPEQLAFLPVWITTFVSISISSLIAVALIGYTFLRMLSRPAIIEPLRSRGLRVLKQERQAEEV